MSNDHLRPDTRPDDSTTVVGHPDAGVVAGPSQWKKYAAAGAFVAILAGGVTYSTTLGGDDGPDSSSGPEADLFDGPREDLSDPLFGEPVDELRIEPDGGDDVLIGGGSSDDVISGGSSDDLLGGDPADDVLIGGDPADDVISGGDTDDLLGGGPGDGILSDDPLLGGDQSLDEAFEPSGLRELCFDVRHQEVPDQDSLTGIWVDGELYGFPPGTWIWVQGPTINGGEGVDIPIDGAGGFEAPLGINTFGEHPIEGFELRDADGHPIADFLGQLEGDGGPGSTITVGPEEGSPFDEPCFQFDPIAPATSADAPAGGATEAPQAEGESPTVDPTFAAETFFADFVAAHVAGDSDALIAGLHPPVRDAFGPTVCDEYVRSTTGSIVAATVNRVGDRTPLQLDGPNGSVSIPDALPVQVDLILGDGTVTPTDAHLVVDGAEVHWLTQCGVE